MGHEQICLTDHLPSRVSLCSELVVDFQSELRLHANIFEGDLRPEPLLASARFFSAKCTEATVGRCAPDCDGSDEKVRVFEGSVQTGDSCSRIGNGQDPT